MKKLLLVLSCLFVFAGTVFAQPDPKAPLKGLKGVYVLVEHIEEKNTFLTQDQLQIDAETRLRKAGIRLLDRDTAIKDPAVGTLYIFLRLRPVQQSKGLYCYFLSVELLQDIHLARDPSTVIINARTYNSGPGQVDTVGEDHLLYIRALANTMVDIFIKDFLDANRLMNHSN